MKICENAAVRLPTVSLYVTGPDFLLPELVPTDQSTAQWTSDNYAIERSPYLLTFVIDSTVGYFDAQSFSYTVPSGYGGISFVLCNLVTQPTPIAGVNNFLMYHVLNGVTGNGIPSGAALRFIYGLYYWDNAGVQHVLHGSPTSSGKMRPMDDPPGITNMSSD